ncbi:S8 family peptidase [Pseudoalteromonas aurantia]|uniref:Alkaline serine protease n=2 Tax=Pseudoalteromonas TaxID=53246 RepID=A0A5S3V0J2_9GAMM|nr:S8 family peptidase [Pseudoalteromonas aurantia]TMO60345.1 alkaline serine protease [Pseudoalteromonas aurantia]TMO63749.1 alkaline serine protease [Pseudoalteromonas aurantia]TMO73688.1 alkaline serine protease [Pseudoalteromonas aurantia]
MRKLSSLTLAILTGLSGQAFAAQMIEVDQAKAIDNKYIVVFDAPKIIDKTDKKAVAAYIAQQTKILSNQYNVTVEREFGTALNGVLVDASKKQIHTLLSNPNVKYIEQDQIVSVTPLIDTKADQGNAIWGLDRVDQTDLPLNSNYHYDYDGSGVTAYVIDTGVLISHNEFGNRASHGYDFIDNDNNATDCNGHGTHVAGTVGGNSYGVAKNVNVVGVRVLGCNGSGSNSGVIAGINWVKNNASGPSVANMSLGGGASQATDDAVNNAVASGISFVVAAGNDNRSACNYSPARAANAITVGSTTSSDGRSSFSNYGNCLDIYAPGSSIKSAWYNSNSATNTISGTSMASPHVAGAVALYLDQDPSLSPSQIDSLLSQRSSKNKVSDAKSGSPNELLYTLGTIQPPPPPPPVTELTNGQAVSANGANGSETMYKISVPAGSTSLAIDLSGGTGDADLYVQVGQQPTLNSYNCRPYKTGNTESCSFANPAAGDWYVLLHGYSQYSGASLKATIDSQGGCGSNCLDNGVPISNISGAQNQELFYTIEVPANVNLSVTTSGGSGDADLYVRKGTKPTTSNYDCRPFRNGNSESCSLNSGQGGTYHIMLRGYSAFSNVRLVGQY